MAEALCNEIPTKILNQWRILSGECGLVPKLQLSQTPRNKNSLARLSQTSRRQMWVFSVDPSGPKPNYVPKTATRAALKKRLNDMVSEKMTFHKKQKTGGFQFP